MAPTMPKPSFAFLKKSKEDIKTPTFPDLLGSSEQTTKSGYKRLPQNERVHKMIEAAAIGIDDANPKLASCVRAFSPVLNVLMRALMVILPIYTYIFKWCVYLYHVLPKNTLLVIFGVLLCFFGGRYLALFAAIEAWRKMGWERSYADFLVVYEQVKLVEQANEQDDDMDENKDGVADVDQIAPHELLKRKTAVAMKAITEPARIQTAVGSLWSAYIAVIATLKLQFAQTVAIALGIAEMVKFPLVRALAPVIALGLGHDLAHWAETIIDTTINFIVILFAWYLQMIISAFYSALRGGKYVADGTFALLEERGILEKAPEWLIKQPYDPNETILDEVVQYVMFAAGFSYQLLNGFKLPFPVNVIFFPLTAVEWILRWQVTFGGTPATTG